MKLSSLKTFLSEPELYQQFNISLQPELDEYISAHKKIGTSSPVVLVEDIEFLFDKNKLVTLCALYLQRHLSEWELAYIVDALLLSCNVRFENNKVLEAAETLTDSEINGRITDEMVQNMIIEFSK